MGKGPVTPSAIRKLITHKDYVVKMVNSIIKETDLNPCAEQTLEDLGASSHYDLSRVRFNLVMVLYAFSLFFS